MPSVRNDFRRRGGGGGGARLYDALYCKVQTVALGIEYEIVRFGDEKHFAYVCLFAMSISI